MTALATKYGKQRTISPPDGDTNGFARVGFRFRPGAIVGKRSGSNLLETPLAASARSDLEILGCYESQTECPAFTDEDSGAALDADGRKVALKVRGGALGGFDTGAGANAITYAHRGLPCFAYDDNTLYLTSEGGTLSFAGIITGVDPDGKIEMCTNYMIRSMWRMFGAGAFSLNGASIPLSLFAFRKVDSSGDVGNIAAIGGVLASNTTPILRSDSAESSEIVWAAGNTDIVGVHVTLPPNVDGSAAATIDLFVYSGTTDLASFTVETSWDGAALVSDSATDAAASATVRKITATIAASDIPASPRRLTVYLTPAAHATDAIALVGACINYKPVMPS